MTNFASISPALDRQVVNGLLGFILGELVFFNDVDVTEAGETILLGCNNDGHIRSASLETFLYDNKNYRGW